ncbi:MAG TPA: MFS transporter [Candidatus Limiplasma sp.]|nr:MFS transporter [Candidatus Limiplasma sp.]
MVIQLVFFLRMLATGIISPVLALMLLAHGGTIETVSLLIGVYSVTVVAAEFPSGVLADLFGQRRTFLLSTLFGVLSFCLVLASQSFWLLAAAMVSMGLSRAFASGTLDALAVNQAQAHEDHSLLQLTSRFAVLESAGLAIGALAGGFLLSIGEGYIVNIAINIGLFGLLFFLTLFCIHETPARNAGESRVPLRTLVQGQIHQSVSFILQKGIVRAIVVLSIVTGFATISVETYWQPAFTAMDPPSWMLGLVSFAGYISVMAGSRLITRILRRHTAHVVTALFALRALLGAGLVALYCAVSATPFIAVYMLSYFFLGSSGVAESTLIHRVAPDTQRSSILSLFSFLQQLGSILASAAGFLVSTYSNYRLMWVAGGVLLLACTGMLALQKNRQRGSCL